MVLKDAGDDSAAMKSHYESKIADILSNLQDSVEAMEFDFRERLYERQELIRQLLVQLQLKNTEFVEYLTSVQDTNDRKTIDLKIEYETKLQQIIEERNALQVNAAVAERKLSDAIDAQDKWNIEKADLLQQYKLDQDKIHCFETQVEILRAEIHSREETLNNSEMHLMECTAAIEEVNKRKENFTLTEKELQDDCDRLKGESEEKNGRISYLMTELKQCERDIAAKDLSIEALKSKLTIYRRQTEKERLRRMTTETTLSRITEDIRKTSESIQDVPELKKMIFTLRERYL